jgi:hypothetical protein
MPVETNNQDEILLQGPELPKEMDWSFVKSTRFWASILMSLGVIIQTPEAPNLMAGKFLVLLGTAFIGIRTIDKFLK